MKKISYLLSVGLFSISMIVFGCATTPPTIPEENVRNISESLFQTIQEIKSKGHNVIIKDCSCGYGFPVIATVCIHRVNHSYHVHIGASPILEIALERSITETLQGKNIHALRGEQTFIKDKELSYPEQLKAYVYGHNMFPIEFFLDTPSYPLSSFTKHIDTSNKYLYQFMCGFAAKQGWDIFVKNFSVLGFPTYRIIVPGVSDIVDFSAIGSSMFPSIGMIQYNCIEAVRNVSAATQDKLYEIIEYDRQMNTAKNPIQFTFATRMFFSFTGIENVVFYKLAVAYAAWETGRYKLVSNTLSYLVSAIQNQNINQKMLNIFHCLRLYLEFADRKLNSTQMRKTLLMFCDKSAVDYVVSAIYNHKNPFEALLPRCDKNCDRCAFRNRCNEEQADALRNILTNRTYRFKME